MINRRLYNQVADAVRAHSGSENQVEAVFTLVCDEIESLAADRVDELLNSSEERLSNVYDPAVDEPPGHTEAEAAQRWCPFTREVTPIGKSKKDAAIGNRYLTERDDFPNPAGCRCIASHCMAWRWTSVDRGRCGLAGPVELMPAAEPRRLHNRVPPAREIPDLFDNADASCRDGVSLTT
jgi:hypothetical protein